MSVDLERCLSVPRSLSLLHNTKRLALPFSPHTHTRTHTLTFLFVQIRRVSVCRITCRFREAGADAKRLHGPEALGQLDMTLSVRNLAWQTAMILTSTWPLLWMHSQLWCFSFFFLSLILSAASVPHAPRSVLILSLSLLCPLSITLSLRLSPCPFLYNIYTYIHIYTLRYSLLFFFFG